MNCDRTKINYINLVCNQGQNGINFHLVPYLVRLKNHLAFFPKDMRSLVTVGNTTLNFSGFPTCFKIVRVCTNQIKNLIVRACIWFSCFSALDTTSCSRLNKQQTSTFYYCRLSWWYLTPTSPVKQRSNWRKFVTGLAVITTATFVFLLRVIAMRILSREHFKQGIIPNEIFHSGLMFIGIVILQALPNEGITQSITSQPSMYTYHFESNNDAEILVI